MWNYFLLHGNFVFVLFFYSKLYGRSILHHIISTHNCIKIEDGLLLCLVGYTE